jgi:GAF domain-containing protein/multidrug resistance efflux pump
MTDDTGKPTASGGETSSGQSSGLRSACGKASLARKTEAVQTSKLRSAWGKASLARTQAAPKPVIAPTAAPSQDTVVPPAMEDAFELERRIRRLTLSRDLTREFVSTTDVKQLMGIIFERVLTAIEAEAGSLWLVDWKTRENVCHQAEGPAREKVLGLRLAKDKGVVGAVTKDKLPQVVLDTSRDAGFASEVDEASGFRTLSMICVPLVVDEQVYGAIQVINKKSGFESRFTNDDVQLVEDLAVSAAVSIKNARLLQSESKVKEMGILLRISREISSTLDLNQVLGLVVNMTGELIEMQAGAVALLEEDKDSLILGALFGEEPIDPKDTRQTALLSLMEKTRQVGRTVYIEDLASYRVQAGEDSKWVEYMDAQGLVSLWASPMADEEGDLGVLWFESGKPRLAEGGKADLLSILANQAAVAVRNASLYHRVPFVETLGRVAEKGQRTFGAWRKWAIGGGALVILLAVLQFSSYFRSLTGTCEVEARLGHGVFLHVAGSVAEITVREGQPVKKGDVVARLDPSLFRLSYTQVTSQMAILERKIVEARAASNAAEMRRLSAEREALRAEATRAWEDLRSVEVRAPRDGLVLTTGLEELIGASLPVGAELLRLADPEHLTVVVHVAEENVLDVALGQEVVGVVRSAPGKRFFGRVSHIGRAYALPPEAVEAQAEPTEEPAPGPGFIAEVEVTSTEVPLRPGMTGKARIMTPESSTLGRFFRGIYNFIVFLFGP